MIAYRVFAAALAAMAFGLPYGAQAADMIGNCEMSGTKGDMAIAAPAKAGQLTVEVSLPAPTCRRFRQRIRPGSSSQSSISTRRKAVRITRRPGCGTMASWIRRRRAAC